jgi:predicted enzyme related to lactoylglutathione lyase
MLKKIDSVILHVSDVAEALDFYADVFGLKPIWQDERAGEAGLLFPDGDSVLVLHANPISPGQVEVRYLVDDVPGALRRYTDQGCKVLVEPFEVHRGRGAIIQDPFGMQICIVDKSRGKAERDLLQR